MYQGTVWFCRGHLLLLLSVQHILSTALITSGYEATGCVTAGAYWTHNMILSSFVYDLLLDNFLYYCSDICYCSCNSDYDSHSIGPWCVFFTRCLGMHCCAGHYVINNFLYFQEWNLHSTCVKCFRDLSFFFSSWHVHFWGVTILIDIPVWVMGVQMNKHQNEHVQSVIMLCVFLTHIFCGSFWPLLSYFDQAT